MKNKVILLTEIAGFEPQNVGIVARALASSNALEHLRPASH